MMYGAANMFGVKLEHNKQSVCKHKHHITGWCLVLADEH